MFVDTRHGPSVVHPTPVGRRLQAQAKSGREGVGSPAEEPDAGNLREAVQTAPAIGGPCGPPAQECGTNEAPLSGSR